MNASRHLTSMPSWSFLKVCWEKGGYINIKASDWFHLCIFPLMQGQGNFVCMKIQLQFQSKLLELLNIATNIVFGYNERMSCPAIIWRGGSNNKLKNHCEGSRGLGLGFGLGLGLGFGLGLGRRLGLGFNSFQSFKSRF